MEIKQSLRFEFPFMVNGDKYELYVVAESREQAIQKMKLVIESMLDQINESV